MGKLGIDFSLGTKYFLMATPVFIVLKLFKIIKWGWLWVFSPLLLANAMLVFFLLIAYISVKYCGKKIKIDQEKGRIFIS